MSVSGDHWLVHVVKEAGESGGKHLDVPARMPTVEVWTLVSRAYDLSDARLTDLVADYFRMDVADMGQADPEAYAVLDAEVAHRHMVFPLSETDRALVVATCDPTNMDVERAVSFASGKSTVFRVASPAAIKDAIDQRAPAEDIVDGLLDSIEDLEEDAVMLVQEVGPEAITEGDARATPVVKLTSLILREGISQGASDIHFEPGRKIGLIRYRVDGMLRKHTDLQMSALNRVISRIKILAQMDIADRLRPQDGRLRVQVGEMTYDLRVSTLPADGAEKCVIRILDANQSFTLDALGFPAAGVEQIRELLGHRDGIVLVTGPTGSGKTTTLYGALRELATGSVNIMTVEDPIEYELDGVTQTHVKVKQDMTFAKALRAILRQDPDVILVGEIRDGETAQVAAQAAMTGHLVLATVHANDAVSSVSRLTDLGLQWPMVADVLRGVVAQRLLRQVCAGCAEPVDGALTPEEERLSAVFDAPPVVRARGCQECGFTGYQGRLPVVEVMTSTPRLREAISARKGHGTLQRIAIDDGMRIMHQAALEWARQGLTTLVEIERVLGRDMVAAEESEEARPVRILLVEDDADARTMMLELLSGDGYEVEVEEDGQGAVDRLAADPRFSLVVLDLHLPGLDGESVLRRIRGSVDTAALPVLVRTGTGGESREAELLEAGADDYVVKSASAERFLARVHAVLRRAGL